ncbi:MAG: glycosyltransferase family 2 protein [Terriglobia bacterium]
MPSISATIITLNEASHIARTIQSLQSADEVIVVDSGSIDGTREIALSLGALVIEHPWEGFAAQKNFAAGQARNDWILSLDADEELDAKAQEAVNRWKSGEPDSAGCCFARRARYLGRWIGHSGWYPDSKVRLYDRRRGRWEGNYVHESMTVNGRVEMMPGESLHYTCDSLEEHCRRLEFYTGLAAEQMLARGERASWLRQKAAPGWTFARSYFLRLGFLDGVPGFWIAWMASRYVAKKYAKSAALFASRRQD